MSLKSLSESSIAVRVADELRASIQSGELRPGERLVERRLADKLGVSHIPVREALTRLAEEGLVEREPRRGARVAVLDQRSLEEISSLRIVLEGFMCLRVRESWNEDSAAEFGSILEKMEGAAKSQNNQEMLRLDAEFHEKLALLADHQLLSDLIAQLRSRITGFLREANAILADDQRREHIESHRRILQAISDGNPDTMTSVISEHITSGMQRILEYRALTHSISDPSS